MAAERRYNIDGFVERRKARVEKDPAALANLLKFQHDWKEEIAEGDYTYQEWAEHYIGWLEQQ